MTASSIRVRAAVAACALACAMLAGAAGAAGYKAPRNAFGQPDLSGVWTNASITQLERPAQFKSLVITPAQAAAMEQGYSRMRTSDAGPTDPNAPAPSKGKDPGGYNAFWIDPGTKVGAIRGELRSSWIVEPADGKLPYSPEGRRLFQAEVTKIQSNFDGPEGRQLAERCLLGFGSTAGPPMLNVLYNNTYQIQQDRDHLVILVEMNHDARIVRLGDRTHPKADIRTWMGDSVGWWEGDALVVETTNFNPGEQLRPGIPTTVFVSQDARVTERFTRVSPTQILYEFKVEDPKVYTKTWRGEMPINAAKGPVYEYACHEGNYALPGILRGARVTEAAGKKVEAADVAE
ncbi:hypothetical protein [Phenylobacterium sp.]|uniref:hypothetical protein n=1 Tax=Phenylobacterium sp. TaxID=1871053 RepID=UPI0025FD380D|nr:hypothetical protein [Phenylobacterium sp.]